MTIRDETTKGQRPLKAKKENTMSKTTTKSTKATTSAKKANKPSVMTYPQAMALTNALFHSKPTAKVMSDKLDKLFANSKDRKGMNPERKAKWLEEHGNEPATYGQCKAYAFGLLNAKTSHEEASKAIEALDKKNGYVRQPKAEKTVKEANETAKAETAKQASLLDDIAEESDNKDTPKA